MGTNNYSKAAPRYCVVRVRIGEFGVLDRHEWRWAVPPGVDKFTAELRCNRLNRPREGIVVHRRSPLARRQRDDDFEEWLAGLPDRAPLEPVLADWRGSITRYDVNGIKPPIHRAPLDQAIADWRGTVARYFGFANKPWRAAEVFPILDDEILLSVRIVFQYFDRWAKAPLRDNRRDLAVIHDMLWPDCARTDVDYNERMALCMAILSTDPPMLKAAYMGMQLRAYYKAVAAARERLVAAWVCAK